MIRSRTYRGKGRALLVLSAFGLMILPFLGCEKMQERQERQMGGPSASYDTRHMALFGVDSLSIFRTGGPKGLAKVYVELPDGSRHFLPDVTEEAVAKNLEKVELIAQDDREAEYGDGLSLVIFRDGKLKRVSLQAGSATWKIAAKESGPYLALPISKADLVAQFGEPDSWGVYVPPRAP